MNKSEQASVSRSGRVICPKCGDEMNFHAEKIDYGAGIPDSASRDASLGGLVEEFHTCPDCKYVLERPSRS